MVKILDSDYSYVLEKLTLFMSRLYSGDEMQIFEYAREMVSRIEQGPFLHPHNDKIIQIIRNILVEGSQCEKTRLKYSWKKNQDVCYDYFKTKYKKRKQLIKWCILLYINESESMYNKITNDEAYSAFNRKDYELEYMRF